MLFRIIYVLFLFILSLFIAPDSYTALTKAQYDRVMTAAKQVFNNHLKPGPNHVIQVNKGESEYFTWWDSDTLHAAYGSYTIDHVRYHNIFVHGGMARLEKMTMDGLAQTVCHEIGHGLGGPPFKHDNPEGYLSSVEGQCDYYSTKVCLRQIFRYLPDYEITDYLEREAAEERCRSVYQNEEDLKFCYRAAFAMEGVRDFFRHSPSIQREVSWLDFDPTVATEINHGVYHYPGAQCRFDTITNGLLGLERPACWFPPAD